MPDRSQDVSPSVTTLVSTTATATGSSAASAGFEGRDRLVVQLEVTAASGTTPSMTVTVEDSVDGTNWNSVQAFTAATTTGRQVLRLTSAFTDQLRVSYTITGTTPSFTFNVKAYSEG